MLPNGFTLRQTVRNKILLRPVIDQQPVTVVVDHNTNEVTTLSVHEQAVIPTAQVVITHQEERRQQLTSIKGDGRDAAEAWPGPPHLSPTQTLSLAPHTPPLETLHSLRTANV